jgi:hypothetical protein
MIKPVFPAAIIISTVMAVAYHRLIVSGAVAVIIPPVVIMAIPWVSYIEHHFIGMVKVEIGICRWQFHGSYPSCAIIPGKSLVRHTVIGFYSRYVVVVHIVITFRPPYGLHTYIDILCPCRNRKDCIKQQYDH